MQRRSRIPAVALLRQAMAMLVLLASVAQAGEFRVGAAQVKITPAVGTPLAGSYAVRASNGALDDLYAKAIVVEQDGVKVALVALDLAYTVRPTVIAVRKLIAQQCGIEPERTLISATHTHSAPVQTRGNLMDKITGAEQPLAKEFTAKLPGLIVEAVVKANARLAPARAAAVVSHEEQISFNRRYWMKDGTLGWMAARSANVERPAGPIDPDVGLCYFHSAAKSGAPLAAYVNFAMHPTVVGGTRFSADYCGRIAQRLAEFKGEELVTLFANGCCGNVNQINPHWPGQGHGLPEAERIGTVLAAAVFRDWPKLESLATFAPRARATVVALPRRKITDDEVAESQRVVDLIGKKRQTIPVMANAVCVLDTLTNRDRPLEAEVQAIAFSNELAIVALPGEIFVELGLALKKASPFKRTFIAELANGSIGYIPNRAAYAEGNYEVVSARCTAGSGETLVDTAVKLLTELHSTK